MFKHARKITRTSVWEAAGRVHNCKVEAGSVQGRVVIHPNSPFSAGRMPVSAQTLYQFA